MIKFGTLDVSDIYKGTQIFEKIYVGGNLVFKNIADNELITKDGNEFITKDGDTFILRRNS